MQKILEYDQKVIRPLLNLFDKLREIFQGSHLIELPQIVVVGNQSTGKTSVLEAFCRLNLPRGEGRVTCTPIAIQMRSGQETEYRLSYEVKENHIINHSPELQLKQSITFTNIDELAPILKKITEQILKIENSEIGFTEITVFLQSPQLPNLTLIDLPGMSYNNKEFEEKVIQIYREYTKNKKAIILSVLSATEDLTNSKAHIIASESDPEKERTLGVITKVDMAAYNLSNQLKENTLNYKLGIFLTRNRNQSEIQDNISFEKARQKEIELLNDPKFNFYPSENKGIEQVIKTLITLQNNQILNDQFRVKDDICRIKEEIEIELKNLPASCKNLKQKQEIFDNFIFEQQQNMNNLFTGNQNSNKSDIHLRPDLQNFFQQLLEKFKVLTYNYLNQEQRNKIKEFLNNSKGIQLPNFISYQSFQFLVQDFFPECNKIQNQFLEQVFQKLTEVYNKIIQNLCPQYKNQYKQFQELLAKGLNTFLKNLQVKIKQNLEQQFKKEEFVIYSPNPIYQDVLDKLRQFCVNKNLNIIYDLQINQQICSPELFQTYQANQYIENQTTEMQLSLVSYANLLSKRIPDTIFLEILCEISKISMDFYNYSKKQFSPMDGKYQRETQSFIINSFEVENKRIKLERDIKLLENSLEEYEQFQNTQNN